MPPNQQTSSSSFVSTTVTTVINHFKPHKAEAIQRIRTNALCLTTTFVVSYLLPASVPSLPTALRTLFSESHYQPWTSEWIWVWVCVLETTLVALFLYNILEATYAIKYPRAPLPHVTSPAKAKSKVPPTSATTPKRPFKVLSPNSSPQPQKPFAFSPSTSLTSASIALSSSTTPGAATGAAPYAQSPLSTPSRVLHYAVPPSSSTTTMASSTSPSEYLATPSPVISAYRGKHAGIDVGRALDGSYLLRIIPDEVVED